MLGKVGWASPITLQAHACLILDIGAQNLGRAALFGLDVDVIEFEVFALSILRAVHARRNIISASARNVLPSNVLDRDSAVVAARSRVNARRNVDGLVDVVEYEIAEGDVADMAIGRVRLNPGCVGGVVTGKVIEDHIVNCFGALFSN